MDGKNNRRLLQGIVVILLLILFTQSRNETVYVETSTDSGSYQDPTFYDAITLSENVIAVVNNDMYSGNFGSLVVLEFDPETQTFIKLGDHSYISDFD